MYSSETRTDPVIKDTSIALILTVHLVCMPVIINTLRMGVCVCVLSNDKICNRHDIQPYDQIDGLKKIILIGERAPNC